MLSRRRLLALAGLAIVAYYLWPAAEHRAPVVQSKLDEFVPAWHFGEFHSIDISAPPERIDRAIREVTADEIWLFRTLTSIRRLGRAGPENILNPGKMPILRVATGTTFTLLADDPDREIVFGTPIATPTRLLRKMTPDEFRGATAPGFVLAVMNFRIEDGRLMTETRVHATDAASKWKFQMYWRTIYPGSALIRREWLKAIKRRAEAPL